MASQIELNEDLKVWKLEMEKEIEKLLVKLNDITLLPATLKNRIKYAEVVERSIDDKVKRANFKEEIIKPMQDIHDSKQKEHDEIRTKIDDQLFYLKSLVNQLYHV